MKKIICLSILILFVFTSFAQNQSRKDAESYNKRGVYLMNKQMFSEAVQVFSYAIEADNTYSVAYLNRAISVKKSNMEFENIDYCGDILKAIELGNKEALKEKAKSSCK